MLNSHIQYRQYLFLPSTISFADLLSEPKIFLPTQVYFPASLRVTLWTSNLPPRAPRWESLCRWVPFPRTHIIVGWGFPLTEHWNAALWFSLTVCLTGEMTTEGREMDSPGSPLVPGGPLRPGIPLAPCAPFWPGGPIFPCFPEGPGSPLKPRNPFLPVDPRGPFLPRDPLGPCNPGGPCAHICSLGEQNDCGDHELMVLFISLLTTSIVTPSGIGRFWDEEWRRVLLAWTGKNLFVFFQKAFEN